MSYDDPAASRPGGPAGTFTQFLDADAQVCAPLPDFARQPEALRRMYRAMVEARAFDKKAAALLRGGQLGGYAAGLGLEAIGTAIGYALKPEDVLIPAYRDYVAQFLRGVKMCEILLHWNGDERGMAGETGPARHDFPLSAPSAAQVPQALGVAYAMKLRREPRVVLASWSEGAARMTGFRETLSLASHWNLPVVFLVSNHRGSLVPADRTGAPTPVQRAVAAGMPGGQVDGNDVIAVRFVLERAVERARGGGGPTLLEAISYRLHEPGESRPPRPEEEVRAAWERCPVKRLRRYLETQDLWSVQNEEELLLEAGEQAESAAREFLATPPRAPEALFDHVYARPPPAYRTRLEAAREAPG